MATSRYYRQRTKRGASQESSEPTAPNSRISSGLADTTQQEDATPAESPVTLSTFSQFGKTPRATVGLGDEVRAAPKRISPIYSVGDERSSNVFVINRGSLMAYDKLREVIEELRNAYHVTHSTDYNYVLPGYIAIVVQPKQYIDLRAIERYLGLKTLNKYLGTHPDLIVAAVGCFVWPEQNTVELEFVSSLDSFGEAALNALLALVDHQGYELFKAGISLDVAQWESIINFLIAAGFKDPDLSAVYPSGQFNKDHMFCSLKRVNEKNTRRRDYANASALMSAFSSGAKPNELLAYCQALKTRYNLYQIRQLSGIIMSKLELNQIREEIRENRAVPRGGILRPTGETVRGTLQGRQVNGSVYTIDAKKEVKLGSLNTDSHVYLYPAGCTDEENPDEKVCYISWPSLDTFTNLIHQQTNKDRPQTYHFVFTKKGAFIVEITPQFYLFAKFLNKDCISSFRNLVRKYFKVNQSFDRSTGQDPSQEGDQAYNSLLVQKLGYYFYLNSEEEQAWSYMMNAIQHCTIKKVKEYANEEDYKSMRKSAACMNILDNQNFLFFAVQFIPWNELVTANEEGYYVFIVNNYSK